jgi:DNA-binding PadR family transcriptional regulator
MTTDVLSYRSASEILKFVSVREGSRNWYGITIHVDQVEGVEKTPPVFHVLKLLVQGGFLRTEPPEASNDAVYFLTEQGKQALAKLIGEPV